MSGLSFRQRAAHKVKTAAWAKAITRASEEHGRPNSFGVRELAAEYNCEIRFGYYLGQIRLHELWEALGGANGWGSCPTYSRGRFYV